jgi:hypothetical protein
MTSPMATPTLLHVFSTFAVGGPQVRFATLANHLQQRFRHLVIAMDGRYDCRERLDPTLSIELPNPRIRKGHTLSNVWTFRRVLRSTRPDLLVTYNWGAIEWAIANWPRMVRHVHIEDGFGPEEAHGQMRRRIWTRRIALHRSTVVVPSRTLEAIAREIWHLAPGRVR